MEKTTNTLQMFIKTNLDNKETSTAMRFQERTTYSHNDLRAFKMYKCLYIYIYTHINMLLLIYTKGLNFTDIPKANFN